MTRVLKHGPSLDFQLSMLPKDHQTLAIQAAFPAIAHGVLELDCARLEISTRSCISILSHFSELPEPSALSILNSPWRKDDWEGKRHEFMVAVTAALKKMPSSLTISGRPSIIVLPYSRLSGRKKDPESDGAEAVRDESRECGVALCQTLLQMTQLTRLNLSDNLFIDQGVFEQLAQGMTCMRFLRHLDLEWNFILTSGAQALSSALQCMPQLEGLSLECNRFGEAGIKALAESLMCLSQLQLLKIQNIDWSRREGDHKHSDDSAANAIAQSVCSMTDLHTLTLGDNAYLHTGSSSLIDCLTPITKLQHLSLRYCRGVGSHKFIDLAQKIATFVHLERLDLSNNEMGNSGAQALSDCLFLLTNLQFLDLKWNSIGETGVIALAECLPELHQLEWVSFSRNLISDGGTVALARHVGGMRQLAKLKLDRNYITAAGQRALQTLREKLPDLDCVSHSQYI
jgi:Ran GTPase-activating protein (RanGAP) involved in mRNA processing and transport